MGISGNYQPAIATADGGLIATTPSGSAVTMDASLNITGIANIAIQSWPGYAYQYGSVDQVDAFIIPVATTFWPFGGANSSHNNTAKKLPPHDASHNHTVTIRYVSGQEGNPAGHITVQVDNNVEVGFAPVHDLTKEQMLANTPVPGQIEQRASTVQTLDAVTIYLTESEANHAQDFINGWNSDPGFYELVGRSCVDFAEAVLGSVGFPQPNDTLPLRLPKDIRAIQIKENTIQAP